MHLAPKQAMRITQLQYLLQLSLPTSEKRRQAEVRPASSNRS
jgi:hypothetical protein